MSKPINLFFVTRRKRVLLQRATRWTSTWRKRECFTVFYRVAVEQTREAVMDCRNIFTQEMLTSMNIMSLIGFNWKVFVLFPIWKWQASVDTLFSSSNSAIRCHCHDLEKQASYNMIATEWDIFQKIERQHVEVWIPRNKVQVHSEKDDFQVILKWMDSESWMDISIKNMKNFSNFFFT